MGLLINKITGESVYLNNQHSFGRNKLTSNTYLSASDVSQFHAIISWKGDAWYIHDQSRNGTIVDGKFINNTTVKIKEGSSIQFGEQENTKWEMKDLEAPFSYFRSAENPENVIVLKTSLAFPNEEQPITYIYPSAHNWILEENEKVEILANGKMYVIENESFVFVENVVLDETMDMAGNIGNSFFKFTLSADEEHIQLDLVTKGQEIDLGERVHNYILLALVRRRLNDEELGISLVDQGWIPVEDLLEELSRELNKEVDIYYLNLSIHRIRKLFIDIKPFGHLLTNVVERRSGEIRFSHPYFQIIKSGKSVGEILVKS